MASDSATPLDIAHAIQPDDQAVADCWAIVQRAVMASYIQDDEDAQQLIAFMERATPYNDMTIEEISFTLGDDDTLHVALLDDENHCSLAGMLEVFRAFKQRLEAAG